MGEPKIGFLTRDDGVSIAYATIGEGPPLVMVPGWVSHLDTLWEGPTWRPFLEQIAEHFHVITFDKHGTGLSDRDRTVFTLESEVQDLTALVDHLGLESFSLLAMSEGGPACIRYAVDHPERIERLLFLASFANGRTMSSKEFQQSFTGLVESSWGFASRAFTDLFFPGGDAETMDRLARGQRNSASREVAAGLLRLIYSTDVRDLLPGIHVPTLIVHRTRDRVVPLRCGREIAVGVPHARFVALEGDQHVPGAGDVDALVRALLEFLLDDADRVEAHFAERARRSGAQADPGTAPASSFQTIMFTDLESSTALTQRLGDDGAQDVLRGHNAIVRNALAAHGGREVKHTGDGIMAAFSSAVRAVEAALQVQRDLAGGEVRVRIGVNAGEPIAEDDDFFGTAVQLAARICDRAEPGQVLVSRVVADLCAGKRFQFRHHSDATLKGFPEPLALYQAGA